MEEVIERQVTQINSADAVRHITMCFKAGLVPILEGHPGIGKSAIYHQVAKLFRLKLVDIRLSQCDPTDLTGFPVLSGKKATYKPLDIFPLESDPIPDGYDGWLILLDELGSASLSVQAASYKLLLDRMVGPYKLNKKAVIGAATNLITSGAIVTKMRTAMQSRLMHYELLVDPIQWSLWASANHLSTEVISYINHSPESLFVFDPEHDEKTFPCPRTWESISKVMLYRGMSMKDKYPSLVGAIGEAKGFEFNKYCEVYPHIPGYDAILSNPTGITIPLEPIMQIALSGIVGSHMTLKDIHTVMPFVYRLPFEFQIFTLRDAIRRNPSMKRDPDIGNWLTMHAEALV